MTGPVGQPLRVVQVLLNLHRGGLESMAVGLGLGLCTRGHDVTFVALDDGGEHEEVLTRAGIEYHILGGRRFRSPRYHAALSRLFRRHGGDVVHTHHFAPLLHAFVSAKIAGVTRLVHTEHSYQYLEGRQDYRRVLRLLSLGTDAFVVVGSRMVPYYRDHVRIGRQLRAIPNGIRIGSPGTLRERARARDLLGLGPGFIVGSAGRFFPVKRYEDLIAAVARAQSAVPGIHLVLIGDGPERPRLERAAARAGVADRVRFPGWHPDLRRLLPALDVFALSSRSEGLPMVVLEAMATGLPIVATAVGDLPEVIRDGRGGVLVRPGAVDALAAALVDLYRLGAERVNVGRAARAAVEAEYGHERMVARYEDVYAGVAECGVGVTHASEQLVSTS